MKITKWNYKTFVGKIISFDIDDFSIVNTFYKVGSLKFIEENDAFSLEGKELRVYEDGSVWSDIKGGYDFGGYDFCNISVNEEIKVFSKNDIVELLDLANLRLKNNFLKD